MELLPKQVEVNIDDVLELLGPMFTNPAVRSYAVDYLCKADDDVSLVIIIYYFCTEAEQ